MNVGVFGGTFDPPHAGHLIVAQDALLALQLDRVLFVPAARPPHKLHAELTAAEVRTAMLRLAIEGDARFDIDTTELDRPGASYTADTLEDLATRQPGNRWTLLVGADQYEEFDTWRDTDRIRRLARVAVLMRGGTHGGTDDAPEPARPGAGDGSAAGGRPGATREILGDRPTCYPIGDAGDVAVEATRIDVSATVVRSRVAAGLPIRYLVPRAVETFIFEQKLYLRNGTPVAG